MKDPTSVSKKNNGKTRQFISAVIINLASISLGIHCGWPSPVTPQLRSSHPPVGDIPLTEDHISWICSLGPVGGLLIIPFCGIAAERIGRKNFAICSGLPHIISWLLSLFAQNHIHLYASRLVGGSAAAMTFFIVPLYISEIASEDIRGFLGSLLIFGLNIGILVAYIAGAYTSYIMFNSLCLIFPIVFVAVMFFVPETPVFLVRRNRQLQAAHKSLMFYRGDNRALVEQELIDLQSQANTSDISRKSVSAREIFDDRATRKGLIISIGILTAQAFSGIAGVTMYAETIFQLAGSSLSSDLASIIIALIQIVGSQASTLLMERAGRRSLSLASCSGMSACLGIVALFFYLQRNGHDVNSFSWLPLVALSGYIITFCLGMGPVPFVIISEVFKLDVASFASTLCFVFYFVICFSAIKTFNEAMQIYGADGCFFMLTIFCAVGFVFCYCLLPETKGRKREDIIDELAAVKKSRGNKKVDVDKDTASKLIHNREQYGICSS